MQRKRTLIILGNKNLLLSCFFILRCCPFYWSWILVCSGRGWPPQQKVAVWLKQCKLQPGRLPVWFPGKLTWCALIWVGVYWAPTNLTRYVPGTHWTQPNPLNSPGWKIQVTLVFHILVSLCWKPHLIEKHPGYEKAKLNWKLKNHQSSISIGFKILRAHCVGARREAAVCEFKPLIGKPAFDLHNAKTVTWDLIICKYFQNLVDVI